MVMFAAQGNETNYFIWKGLYLCDYKSTKIKSAKLWKRESSKRVSCNKCHARLTSSPQKAYPDTACPKSLAEIPE